MFWGLIMEPQRRYTQQVKKAFHISMAALDLSTSSDEPAQVMCGFEGRNYLLCTLKKPDMLQCPLDLNFNVGSEVSFAANGKCHVHLTGYLTDELDIVEEESEEEQEKEIPIKSKKRNKKALENGPPNKKPKSAHVTSTQEKSIDSDSDDSDVDVKTLLEKSLEDSDDDDSDALEDDEAEEEDDEEDEESENEEEEDSSLSVGESDEEERENIVSPKVNGVPKKQDQEVQKQKSDKKKKEDRSKKSLKKDAKNDTKTQSKENVPRRRTLQGGVVVEDIKEGQGTPAKNGKFVNVYYEGRLKQNNKLFDATNKGSGFSFRLGSGEVIKGWDIGVLGMKPGGKRKIICPPSMGYGQKGSPPAIPPNSTLVFEVELKKIS